MSEPPLPRPAPLPLPCLALITDRRLAGSRSLAAIVTEAVAGGVNLVQLREKDLPAGELYELAVRLRTAIGRSALLLVNDRLDVALAAGLDGVHLPATGLPPAVARTLAPDRLIGASVHDAEAARRAIAAGAGYVQFGTVFPSRSKPGRAAAGLEALRQVGAATPGPVLAVGGIDATNAADTRRAGAAGCAVISEIMAAADPRAAARTLWTELQRR